jgi:septal ring-binding cell division protein DamX
VAAAERLSAELRELDPWVRSIKAGSRLIPID